MPLTRVLIVDTSAYTAASSVDWIGLAGDPRSQFAPAATTAASAMKIADTGTTSDLVWESPGRDESRFLGGRYQGRHIGQTCGLPSSVCFLFLNQAIFFIHFIGPEVRCSRNHSAHCS